MFWQLSRKKAATHGDANDVSRLPDADAESGRGLWLGEQFFDPPSGGVGVQDLWKLGLMRSKRAVGVLTVETIGRIRRGHFLKGSSTKVRIRYPGWYGDSRFGGPIGAGRSRPGGTATRYGWWHSTESEG